MAALRARLTTALTAEFERAQEKSAHRLQDLAAPYARFVRAEETRWRDAERSLTALQQRTAAALAALGGVEAGSVTAVRSSSSAPQ